MNPSLFTLTYKKTSLICLYPSACQLQRTGEFHVLVRTCFRIKESLVLQLTSLAPHLNLLDLGENNLFLRLGFIMCKISSTSLINLLLGLIEIMWVNDRCLACGWHAVNVRMTSAAPFNFFNKNIDNYTSFIGFLCLVDASVLGKYYIPFLSTLVSAFAYNFLSPREPPASFKTNSFFKASPAFFRQILLPSFLGSQRTLPLSLLWHLSLVVLSQWATCSWKFQVFQLPDPAITHPIAWSTITQSKEGKGKTSSSGRYRVGLVWRRIEVRELHKRVKWKDIRPGVKTTESQSRLVH